MVWFGLVWVGGGGQIPPENVLTGPNQKPSSFPLSRIQVERKKNQTILSAVYGRMAGRNDFMIEKSIISTWES